MDKEFIIDIPICKPKELTITGRTFHPENYQFILNDDRFRPSITDGKLVLIKDCLNPKIVPVMKEIKHDFDHRKCMEIYSSDSMSKIEYLVQLMIEEKIGTVLEWTIGNIKVKYDSEEIYNYIKETINDKSYYRAKHMAFCFPDTIEIDGIENNIVLYLFGFSLL